MKENGKSRKYGDRKTHVESDRFPLSASSRRRSIETEDSTLMFKEGGECES